MEDENNVNRFSAQKPTAGAQNNGLSDHCRWVLVETMLEGRNNSIPATRAACLILYRAHIMPDDTPTITFGYGSNIWIDQMNRRCPDNKYIGVAILREW